MVIAVFHEKQKYRQLPDVRFLIAGFSKTKANAPAIAFPYVRVFISNITLNAGYNPIVLPSFNFIKLAEENKG